MDKILAKAIKACGEANAVYAAKAAGMMLLIKLPHMAISPSVIMCMPEHKGLARMKAEADIVIDIENNKILKNRFGTTVKKEKA